MFIDNIDSKKLLGKIINPTYDKIASNKVDIGPAATIDIESLSCIFESIEAAPDIISIDIL